MKGFVVKLRDHRHIKKMKSIELKKKSYIINGTVRVGGSKSESNRLLIFRAIFPYYISMENISDSEDTHILHSVILNNNWLIDVEHAGTSMRFFTAYCAIQSGKKFLLKGSKRMHERPIGILIEALTKLGGHIEYIKDNGYPPIKVYGQSLNGGSLSISSDISSQYISALLLIGSTFKNGLELELSKKITSAPYISMTVALLRKIGIYVYWKYNKISIIHKHKKLFRIKFFVESDWSSASYYYSLAALAEQANIFLSRYRYNNKKSIQGDRALVDIYHHYFGVQTVFEKQGISLKKNTFPKLTEFLAFDLNKCPDIAQTLAITCTGLKIRCVLIGLETLKIKETDRLKSMLIELEKVGACVKHSENSLEILHFKEFLQKPIFTYQDHRMAMSFAPLALHKQLIIHNHDVVKKSYPSFWKHLKKLGFSIRELR